MNLKNVVVGKRNDMQVNDVKDIYNHKLNGKPVHEGKAKLRRHWTTEGDMEYWEVQFVSDNHVADRWIKRTPHDKNRNALDRLGSALGKKYRELEKDI